MEQSQKIEIAIDMLAGTILDRYWVRLTHLERDIITNNAINILKDILINIEENDALIIPKPPANINPPDES